MRHLRLLGIVSVLGLAARAVSAQPNIEPTGKNFHKILSFDSVQFRGLVASPDGRWLVMGAVCGLTECSKQWGGEDALWIMPSDGHAKPTRLLSAGYNDRDPVWFPSGDRLAFVSNRASRDGAEKTYAMTVSIDTKTGKAASPPRQISTDQTPAVGQVSPDGKWLTYWAPHEKAIKTVPTNGGTARTLVQMDSVGPPFVWSRDGQAVYFVVGFRGRRPPAEGRGVWYKVSVSGGSPTRAYENPAAMPYPPNPDLHIVFVQRARAEGGGVKRVELYDAKERKVGATDVVREMELFFPHGAPTGMYATMSNRRYENYLVNLENGTTRMLSASRFAWANGWLDNSTITIDGRDSATGRSIVGTLDTAGHESHVLLPEDAGGCCGWYGVVGSNISFARGRDQYIADARTGVMKQLASTGDAGWASYGRGGFYSDGDRFLIPVLNGDKRELRAYTADGRSTLLRTFGKSDSVLATTAHGDLVAWAIRSKDSITVFAARGPTGRPQRLTTVKGKAPDRFFEIAWSYDATMVAVTGLTVQPSLSIVHVDQTGAARGAPTVLNPRATEPWTLRWTPDNRSVIVTAIPLGAKEEVVERVPVDPNEAPTFYSRNDEWLFVSPDGKHVAYPATRTLGMTIWRVDFVPTATVEQNGKARP